MVLSTELVGIHYTGSAPFLLLWSDFETEFWQNPYSRTDINISWLKSSFDGSFDYLGKFPNQLAKGDWGQLLAISLQFPDGKKGCFALASPKGVYLQETDKNIFKVLGEHILSQIKIFSQKKRLEELANTDTLTGIPNRKALSERLTEELYRFQRYGSTNGKFCLSILDLDGFKAYNDTFGHQIGDMILKDFSLYLRNTLRDSDFLARLGGDEFVILFPETSINEGKNAIERIIKGLEHKNSFYPSWASLVDNTHPVLDPLGCSFGLLDVSILNPLPR